MDKQAAVADLTDLVGKFTAYIGKRLPTDVTQKLGELRTQEVNFLAKEVYESMRENQEQADKLADEIVQIADETPDTAAALDALEASARQGRDEAESALSSLLASPGPGAGAERAPGT